MEHTSSLLTEVSQSSESLCSPMLATWKRLCEAGIAPASGSGIIISGKIRILAISVLITTDDKNHNKHDTSDFIVFLTLDCVLYRQTISPLYTNCKMHFEISRSANYPFKVQWYHVVTFKSVHCHPGLAYIFNFWHSGTLALRAERQSARMSEIKNVG